ncbi:hypothetical protein CAP35_07395 [Chitinophagaceae bacterium IBVUCB1]|nr:hypothetical protein CAP35_07395 [Chitinophagaceae bacterium IBVUCB1]
MFFFKHDMYRLLMAVYIWLGFFQPIYAQDSCNITVDCRVVETHNGQPLYPVSVYIDEMKREFETDEDGRFQISNACAGKYHIHFHAAGYEHLVKELNITANASLKFSLSHIDNELDEVIVADDHTKTIIQSKSNMNRMDIVANSGKTLGDMLQRVNGVSVLSNGATIAKPVIHGLYGNRIIILNNGIRQEDQQWGSEHAPNIDPFLANNITVLKGASGVRYGTDAIGGVVLVEPSVVRTMQGWGGEVNFAGFSNNRMGVASATVEHGFKYIKGLGIRLQGTLKQGGNYRIPGHWAANTGTMESNYSATLAYKRAHFGAEVFYSHFNTQLGVYRGAHTGNEKDLLFAINSDTPTIYTGFTYNLARPMQHISHDLWKLKLNADNRAGAFSLVYAYQHNYRQEYDVIRGNTDKAQLNLTLNTQTLNLNFNHKAIGGITGQIGIDGTYQENYMQDGDRLFIPNYRSPAAAAYIIERYRLRKLTLEAGLRYDYKHYEVYNPEGNNQAVVRYDFDYSNASGTIGLKYKVKPNWEWTATLANAWRTPQANELFSAGLHHSAARIELGDKNLLPEKAYSLNVETIYNLPDKWHAEVSLYSQYINDFIYLSPGADILTIRGYFKTFSYRQTDAWLNGADVSVRYQIMKPLEAHLKTSFLFARDIQQRDWLILMPADRVSAGLKHRFNISKTVQDVFVGIDARYVFRQWRIPANFDAIDNPRPPMDYTVLDAEAGASIMLNGHPVYCSITVMNMLNKAYRDYMDAFRYFINQQGTNAVLRLRIPFNFYENKSKI